MIDGNVCINEDEWVAAEEDDAIYHIRIIRRDGMGQTRDDYHATVTRVEDGVKLIWISDWRSWLEWKLRRRALLDRAFKSYDKHQEKLAEVKEEVIR